jgi:hypothetical protein
MICIMMRLLNGHIGLRAHRAKDKWVKEGDANTKYFHTIAYHNFKKHIISRLIVNGFEVRDLFGD